MSGVQYEVHIQYQPDVKAKLDIVHFQHNQFSGWSVPNTYLTVDFITKLPLVAGKDVILVVCNRLSKITHFVATAERITSEGLARQFRDNVWKLHELPESVVLDRGLQFAAELTKELN